MNAHTSALDFGPGTSEADTDGAEGSSGIKSEVLKPLLVDRIVAGRERI
jgi:hypothetical protein